ncbi:peroxiredoxin [Kiritimatiellaeota bacterium B1221]|nr:peroxiredoxin [Kiritimatiellaeota bacterium B1221]
MSCLVSRPTPDFVAPAVMPDGQIRNDFQLSELRGKYTVLFFWPLDFTFVCPTEILAHNSRIAEFKKRNVEVIGISIDSAHTHLAWRNTPVNQGGIGPVDFTMVADHSHRICQSYGIEHPDEAVALRASFLIDKDGIVQHQVVNNLPIGRNVDELLRVVDALQFTEEFGEVCPAGWKPGDEGMKADADGVSEYLTANAASL